MPNRPHHSPKFKRCLAHVKASGKDESAAYAICTASLGDSSWGTAKSASPLRKSVSQAIGKALIGK